MWGIPAASELTKASKCKNYRRDSSNYRNYKPKKHREREGKERQEERKGGRERGKERGRDKYSPLPPPPEGKKKKPDTCSGWKCSNSLTDLSWLKLSIAWMKSEDFGPQSKHSCHLLNNILILKASEVWAFFHSIFSTVTWLDSWAWSPAISILNCPAAKLLKSLLLSLKTFVEVDNPHYLLHQLSITTSRDIVLLLLCIRWERIGVFRAIWCPFVQHTHAISQGSTEWFSYFLIICFLFRVFLTLSFEKTVLFKMFVFATAYVEKAEETPSLLILPLNHWTSYAT